MTASCASPIPTERLLEYFLGELSAEDEDQLEIHLFGCATCAEDAGEIAGLATTIRGVIPAVLARSHFEALEGAGMVTQLNVMAPGDVSRVSYPPSGKLLVHRLEGNDFGSARRIDVALRTIDGEVVGRFEDVPFEASRGEVFLACQHHFAEQLPHDLIFVLHVVSDDESRPIAEYTVLHRLPEGPTGSSPGGEL